MNVFDIRVFSCVEDSAHSLQELHGDNSEYSFYSFRCFIKMNQIKEKRSRQRESTLKMTCEMRWKMQFRKFAMRLAVQLVFLSRSGPGL